MRTKEMTDDWKQYVEEHRPAPKEDEIRNALLALMKACDLTGESGTDHLFHVLLEACKRVKSRDYRKIVLKSYRDGLCFDVTWLITERIMEVMTEWDIVQSRVIPPCQRSSGAQVAAIETTGGAAAAQ
jgi:hypothetical protein